MDADFLDQVIMLNNSIIQAGIELARLIEQEEKEKKTNKKNAMEIKRTQPRCRMKSGLIKPDKTKMFEAEFENLRNSPDLFTQKYNMPPDIFDEFYGLCEPYLLPKRNTRPHDFIPAREKLAVVLEYLACGRIEPNYRICGNNFYTVLDNVCQAINIVLANEIPSWTEEMLLQVADGFQSAYNFPNCVGAMDWKYVVVKTSSNNVEEFSSLGILAMCDAHCKLTYVEVGGFGDENDFSNFQNTQIGKSVLDDACLFPPDVIVNSEEIPYFIVSNNEAFPLAKRILKPYDSTTTSRAEHCFNNRSNGAILSIENTFNILRAKWQCLGNAFNNTELAQNTIWACCLLHNFLVDRNRQTYCSIPSDDSGANWLTNESRVSIDLTDYSDTVTDYGKYVRDVVKEYVNS